MPTDARALERADRWRRARSVLAIRLDNLGDVLMTTPALAAIRQALPEAHLALLGAPGSQALVRHLPMLDEFIGFAAPWVKASVDTFDPDSQGMAELALVERLRARRFDAAIVFTVCTQSALPAALACRMAGIPLRLAHSRENPYGLLSEWVPDPDEVADGMRHEVERQLALVASVGYPAGDEGLVFELGERDRAGARRLLADAGLPADTPYLVVHPGATAASRRYPAECFGLAVEEISAQSGLVAVFTGSEDERPLVEAARERMSRPSLSLAGRLALGELGGLIEGARLLLANNTGPVHLAAALGTPVVDLYAQTNPQHTPWRVASRVLYREVPCRHCLKSVCPQVHHACLRAVTPQEVVQAALGLLAEASLAQAPPSVPCAEPALADPRGTAIACSGIANVCGAPR